ncbi:hypothetical protein MRA01_55000 [Methylobacterium radiotolerans]|nr:hypothetical protein MRA01_55000 [Methylobacterium radiotolerans]
MPLVADRKVCAETPAAAAWDWMPARQLSKSARAGRLAKGRTAMPASSPSARAVLGPVGCFGMLTILTMRNGVWARIQATCGLTNGEETRLTLTHLPTNQ